jgi:O-antigen ligase
MFQALQRAVLFAVGFSLPLQGLHLRFLGLSMTATKLVALVLLLLGGLQIASGVGRRPADRRTLWLAFFLFSYALSSIVGLVRGIPWAGLIAESSSLFALVLYYFLLTYVVRTRDDLVLLLWAVLLGGAMTALPAVLGQETGNALEAEGSARFKGLSGQANIFGRDMVVCIAGAAALYLNTRSTSRKLMLLGAGSLVTAGLVMSLSRAALVAAGAMWGLWLVRFRRFGGVKYIVPALLLTLAALVFMPDSVRQRIETITDPSKRAEEGSAEGRLELSLWALRAFKSNPIYGVGNLYFVEWAQRQPGGRGIVHVVHNGYLEVASAQGLLGFVPWMMILALAWGDYSRAFRLAGARRRRGDPRLQELGNIAVFLQIALFGTLVIGLAHPLTKAKTLWTLLALSPVVLALVRKRVAEIEASPAAAPEMEPFAARPIGLRPSPNAALR